MDNKRFDFPVRNVCDIIIRDLQGNLYHINKIWVNGNDDMVVEIKREGEQYE